jgi:hypothetical protein
VVDFDIFGDLLSCLTGVEANTGSGWGARCTAGNCTSITGNMAANASLTVQARLTNGPRSSPAAQVTLIADSIAPAAILSPTQVIAAGQPFLQGTSSDPLPRGRRAAARGGESGRRSLCAGAGGVVRGSQPARALRSAEAGDWLFPVRLGELDGEIVAGGCAGRGSGGQCGRSLPPRRSRWIRLGQLCRRRKKARR